MPLFRRPKQDVPLTALGRPWRSSVEPGLRTGLFDEPDEAAGDQANAGDPEVAAVRATLDAEIVSDLDDFADAVETLTPGDMARLHAFWRNIDEDARFDAYEHAQPAAERTGRRDVIRQFQDDLGTWSRVYSEMGRVAQELMLAPGDGLHPLAHGREEIRPALVDTMVALALQDELDDADFDTLFGPWRDAIGEDDDGPSADGPADGSDAGEKPPRPIS